MRVKEKSEKAGLKLNIQNTKVMAPGSITLLQAEREKVETVTHFLFLGSKITVDDDCSHEVRRCMLAPWKQRYDKSRQCIKQQRYCFANKGLYSESYGFSSSHVWM